MSYNKLVRDKIPDIIKEKGENPIIRILDDSEYKLELERKLLEEYNEVLESDGESRLEELADMIEVISYLAKVEGASLDKVVEIANVKNSKRGGFQDKIYLIGVDNNN